MEQISIDRLIPMHEQPRTLFDQKNLEGLAQSIQTHGIIQPLVVTQTPHGNFFIVVGERRWRAARLAGLATVPCIIREIKEHERLEIAIIENIQREAMSPLEEANSYQRLIEEYDYTHELIAKKLGKSRSAITNALRILELPKTVMDDLKSNMITAAHARTLCGIEDETMLRDVHKTIIAKKLSVRNTEDLIREKLKHKRKKRSVRENSPELQYMSALLKDRYGTNVTIKGNSKKGVVEFSYYSMEDLERFLDCALQNHLDKVRA